MKINKSKGAIEKLLFLAGIKINGKNPWDVQVHNEDVYRRILFGGSLALGESYMDGWWDCERLDEFFNRVLKAGLVKRISKRRLFISFLIAKVLNLQSRGRAFQIGEKHYDNGNDLYKIMLDKRLTYTCGYWKDAKDLDSSQEAKLDLICKKLDLKKGDNVLDIGCGWGSFLKYASEKYGIKGVGITVSKEQVKLAKELCNGLNIEIKLQDYRDVNGKFDHIVSIGMFEHVGVKNYREYMEIVNKNLNDNGLFLLHTIGNRASKKTGDPWILKYIFPNSMLPSIKQVGDSIENLFVMEDWHNFGANYDKTLMAWHKNFEKGWSKIENNYDERFHRMWRYYLLSVAGSFRARKAQLWQIVFSKNGVAGGYQSVR
ncbi:MAG: cyclopropane fatty acyl phospholipid synthase [Nanoarchaeota archaeon]|nr:cyclopropane fatty acyl phospholipid synthase [Nanoarchaeota archaeon]